MIKSIERLKVRIDQNLNRAEKTEALSEDVVKVESRISSLKQLCQSVTKRLSSDAGMSSSSGKLGNDGAAVEKRIRKTSEFALSQTFQENGRAYAKPGQNGEPVSGLTHFLMDGGHLLNSLATLQVTYEIAVEQLVLQSLAGIVDDHVPSMAKERKNLSSLLLEYDGARGRLANYRNKEGSGSSGGGTVESDLREEKLSSDLADIETKLNFARDSVELHMLQFLSKEADVGATLLRYLELRRDYHRDASDKIAEQIGRFQSQLASPTVASPVFGCPLDDHLRKLGPGATVALPVRSCVCRLLQMDAVREEGLFRVASSTLRIKRLAAFFDTGQASDEHLLEIADPHVFAGTLKLYLRELPTPLLGSNFDDWISVGSLDRHDRKLESIDSALSALPQPSRVNLHYILKFLSIVAAHSDVNKMTAANLSIVMAPNLLWKSDDGDISRTSAANDVVEMLIDNVDHFFRGLGGGGGGGAEKAAPDFFREVTLERPKRPLRAARADENGHQAASPAQARTPVPRPRQSRSGKQAPPLAPRPADRASLQFSQNFNSGAGDNTGDATHL